jgi:hypothetical protein
MAEEAIGFGHNRRLGKGLAVQLAPPPKFHRILVGDGLGGNIGQLCLS